MFTHSLLNPFHFIFNMLWLWWMGRPVEETVGVHSFLSIYFGAGLVGALVDVIVSLVGVANPNAVRWRSFALPVVSLFFSCNPNYRSH